MPLLEREEDASGDTRLIFLLWLSVLPSADLLVEQQEFWDTGGLRDGEEMDGTLRDGGEETDGTTLNLCLRSSATSSLQHNRRKLLSSFHPTSVSVWFPPGSAAGVNDEQHTAR